MILVFFATLLVKAFSTDEIPLNAILGKAFKAFLQCKYTVIIGTFLKIPELQRFLLLYYGA
jgi:hypothetical protein